MFHYLRALFVVAGASYAKTRCEVNALSGVSFMMLGIQGPNEEMRPNQEDVDDGV